MSIKIYSFCSIFFYGLALYSPILFRSFGVFQTGDQPTTALTVAYCGGAVIQLLLYFAGRKLFETEKRKTSVWTIMGMGITGIFLAMTLQMILIQIEQVVFHTQLQSENTQNIITMLKSAPVFLVAISIAGPIMEEFAFRRALTGIIANYTSFWVGAVASSAIFAFAHNDGHLLVYFGLGFLLAILYRFTGSIFTSMITHVGINTVVTLIQVLFG